jgi:hypothetical protein
MREEVLKIRVSSADKALFEIAATESGLKLGSWARDALLGVVIGGAPPPMGEEKATPKKISRLVAPRRVKPSPREVAAAVVAELGAGAVVLGKGEYTGESKFGFGHFNYEYQRPDGSKYWSTEKPS